MMKILKNNYIFMICFFIIILKGNICNIISNINLFTKKQDNIYVTENNILKTHLEALQKEYDELTDIGNYSKYNYILTRISYRLNYSNNKFEIIGGNNKNFKENMAVINGNGLVGIIDEVHDMTSTCIFINGVNNLSVNINDVYGTITGNDNDLLIVSNISNYDKININDLVYTSTYGSIKEKIYIGRVYNIEKNDIEKKIYVKIDNDFNDVNYLYVVGDL